MEPLKWNNDSYLIVYYFRLFLSNIRTEPTSSKVVLSTFNISEIKNGCFSDKFVSNVRHVLRHCSLVILSTNPIY